MTEACGISFKTSLLKKINHGLMFNTMTTDEAIALFGPAAKIRTVAEKLGISAQAVYRWGGTVPPLRVYQLLELAKQAETATPVAESVEEQAA